MTRAPQPAATDVSSDDAGTEPSGAGEASAGAGIAPAAGAALCVGAAFETPSFLFVASTRRAPSVGLARRLGALPGAGLSVALGLVEAFTFGLALAFRLVGEVAFETFFSAMLAAGFFASAFLVFCARALMVRERRPRAPASLPRLRAPPSAFSTSVWARAAAISRMASVNRSTNEVTTWATK